MPATYEPLGTITISSPTSDITFSSVSGYTDLRVVIVGETDSAIGALRFNGDTGNFYSSNVLRGDSGSVTASRATTQNYINFTQGTVFDGSNRGMAVIDIFSYAGSNFKPTLSFHAADDNTAGSVRIVAGLWRSSSAVTSVTLLAAAGSWQVGTTATIFGILKA